MLTELEQSEQFIFLEYFIIEEGYMWGRIPDKTYAYALAKSRYASLADAGVKLYECTPGFVHAKVFVSDDCKTVVGAINLNYRSLYLYFECAIYLYRVPRIRDIADDFNAMLAQCQEVTAENIKNEKISCKVVGSLLKIVAPLM